MIPKRLQAKLDRPLVIYEDSWHARVYHWWEANAEFKTYRQGYEERRCHYWRVVTVWAPIDWLLFTRLWRIPAVLYALLASIAVLAVLSPDWVFELVMGTLAAIVLPLGLTPKSFSKRWESQVKKILTPLAPFGRWLVRMKVIHVLGGLAALFLLFGLVQLILLSTWEFWLAALVTVVAFAVLILVVRGSFLLVRRIRGLESATRRSGHVVRDTAALFLVRAASAKRTICPRVEFRSRPQ